jgi:pimeloyl-ACP methyl ester carboxylesterase
MPYIKTRDEQTVFVRDIGPEKYTALPPVILLHGFGMQSAHWLPFVYPLARKQRFIIPDLRGFGRSHDTHHDRDCIISNYADDLADIVAYFGLERFKLAGISMGAFVALKYLDLYGDHQIDHYLHIDQSPKCLNDEHWQWGLFGDEQTSRLRLAGELISELDPYIAAKTPYDKLPAHLKTGIWNNLGDFFASAMSQSWQKQLARKLCAQESLARQLMPVSNWPVYIHCLRAYLEQNYDMRDILQKLQTPMSILVGLKSEMYPCGGQLRIADHHRNCRIIPFTRSGHTPLIDQPLLFLKTLRRFAREA